MNAPSSLASSTTCSPVPDYTSNVGFGSGAVVNGKVVRVAR